MDPEILTAAKFNDRLFDIIDEAEDGGVFIITDKAEKPLAVLIGAEEYHRLAEAMRQHGIARGHRE